MKKKILKSTFVVVALTIAGYGGVEAYKTYAQNQSCDLLSANIEALASSGDASEYEYPHGLQTPIKCSVNGCKVKYITCPGGGTGCNHTNCPTHGTGYN